MNPDFASMYPPEVFDGKTRFTVMPVYLRTVFPIQPPYQDHELHGMFYGDDDSYMVSVFTKQSWEKLRRLIAISGGCVKVEGKFSTAKVVGGGGEIYRPIIGKVSAI